MDKNYMNPDCAIVNSNNEVITVDSVIFNQIARNLTQKGWVVDFTNTEKLEPEYSLNGLPKTKDEYFEEFKTQYQNAINA